MLLCLTIRRHYGTNEAMADPRFTEPDDDKTHLPSGMSARNLRAVLPAMGADTSRRNLNSSTTQKYGGDGDLDVVLNSSYKSTCGAGNEKALMLLDPSNRPTWNGTAAAGAIN